MRVTLVGSTRFAAKFLTVAEALSLEGHTVYGLGFTSGHKEEGRGPTDDQKVVLDLVHLKKIIDSDAVVLVTDDTYYFGESTRRELAWAMLVDKPCFVGPEGLKSATRLLTPQELKDDYEQRRAHSEKMRAMLGDAVPLGALLQRAAMGGGLPGEDDDEEGDDHGKPN